MRQNRNIYSQRINTPSTQIQDSSTLREGMQLTNYGWICLIECSLKRGHLNKAPNDLLKAMSPVFSHKFVQASEPNLQPHDVNHSTNDSHNICLQHYVGRRHKYFQRVSIQCIYPTRLSHAESNDSTKQNFIKKTSRK